MQTHSHTSTVRTRSQTSSWYMIQAGHKAKKTTPVNPARSAPASLNKLQRREEGREGVSWSGLCHLVSSLVTLAIPIDHFAMRYSPLPLPSAQLHVHRRTYYVPCYRGGLIHSGMTCVCLFRNLNNINRGSARQSSLLPAAGLFRTTSSDNVDATAASFCAILLNHPWVLCSISSPLRRGDW